MKKNRLRILASVLLGMSSLAYALEVNGAHIADSVKLGGKDLVLNGTGLRLKTFLNVKIYVGALYVEKKSSNATEILDSPELKRVELAFIHDASAERVRNAWDESLDNNCKSGCEIYKAPVERLKAKMVELKDGDRMAFDIYPAKVDIWVKGSLVDSIEGPQFPKQLLKSWLGNPPNEELKTGMLGLK